MKLALNKIKQNIIKAKRILLLAHNEPDGDAIGSCIMLESIIKKINPKTKIEKKISANYRETVSYYVQKYNFKTAEVTGSFDYVVALDTSTVERLPSKKAVNLNIDHHGDNEKYAELNIVDKHAPAVGIILYDLIQAWKIKLNKQMAEGLYLSIYTDTGNFSFANTDKRCFKLAEICVEQGINPHEIYRHLNEQRSLISIRAFADALQTIEMFCKDNLILAVISNEKILDNRTLIDYIRQEKKSKVAAVLVAKNKYFKISLRSKGGIDVAVVARHFNGGGHAFAAAGKIYAKNINEAKNILVKYFEKNVF